MYAKQLEDLPLEDIAKEMQDSWQLKVGPTALISSTHMRCLKLRDNTAVWTWWTAMPNC